MAKPGDKVIAISHSDKDVLYIYGEGTYLGDKIPSEFPEEHRPVGQVAEIMFEGADPLPNPCIQLDNGQLVWGCECWWGSPEGMKSKLEGFNETKTLDIQAQRAEHKK